MNGTGNNVKPDEPLKLSAPLNQEGNASDAELNTMDAIASSIGEIGEEVKSMSTIMTALSTGLGDFANGTLSSTIDSVNSNLTAIGANITGLLATVEHDDAANKFDAVIDVLSQINANLDTQSQAFGDFKTEMLKASQDATAKQTHADISDNKNALETMYKLVETFVDEKKTEQFNENRTVWKDGFTDLAYGLDILSASAQKLDAYKETLSSVASISENIAMTFEDVAKSSIAVTLSIAGIFAMFSLMDNATIIKATIGFPVMCAAVAGGLYLIGQAIKQVDPVAVKQFSVSMVILTSAFLLMNYVEWSSVAKGVVAMTGSMLLLAAGIKMLSYTQDKKTNKAVIDFGKNVAIFAASVGILGLSTLLLSYAFENVSWDVLGKGAIVLVGATLVLAVAMRIMSTEKKSVADFGWSMLAIVGSIALLGLTLPWFQEQIKDVNVSTYLIAAACIGVLAVATLLIGQSKENVLKGAGALLIMTAVVALVPFAVKQYDDISWEQLGKPGAVLGALTVATVAVGLSAKHAIAGAVATLVMVGSIAALAYIIPKFDDIQWESIGKVGACIGGLVAAMYLAGASVSISLPGAAALVVGAAAILVLSKGLEPFENISWEAIGKAGAAVGGLAVAMALAGAMSVPALLGAGALLIGSTALLVLGKALTDWPTDISFDQFKTMGLAIGLVSGALAAVGLVSPLVLGSGVALTVASGGILAIGAALKRWPYEVTTGQYETLASGISTVAMSVVKVGVLAPLVIAGSVAGLTLGAALQNIASGIKESASVDLTLIQEGGAADQLMTWAGNTVDKLTAGMSLLDIGKAIAGMTPIYMLGSALSNISNAVIDMANGTYNEYEIVDGKPKIVAVKHIGPETFEAFATSLSQLVDGITEPLAEFGKGGGWFSKSDTEKGIDALSNIGGIIQPMVDAATHIDEIKNADFSIFGPKFQDLLPALQQVSEVDDKIKFKNVDKAITTITKAAKDFADADSSSLLKDTVIALNELGTLNLSDLQKVKDNATKELYEHLTAIEEKLTIIGTNTENTTDAIMPAIKVDPATGKPDLQLNEGDTVDMATIGYMLKRIMTAIEVRR